MLKTGNLSAKTTGVNGLIGKTVQNFAIMADKVEDENAKLVLGCVLAARQKVDGVIHASADWTGAHGVYGRLVVSRVLWGIKHAAAVRSALSHLANES